MVLNIKIFEEQIIQGDTSHIRKEMDALLQSSAMIKKHEDDIFLNFQGLTPYDIFRKLKNEQYRTWFKKLDTEIPGLPFFLNESSNSLLFFLMGNISFDEKNSSVLFDKMEASRFFKEKIIQMRNLCVPHNINPQTGITKLSKVLSGETKNSDSGQNSDRPSENSNGRSTENEKKKGAIKDFLDRYGSIAFLNSDRTVKLTIVINEIPSRISFIRNFLVKDPALPQQFFLTVLKTDSGISEIKSLLLASINDIESSIQHHKGVFIQVVTKSEDGSYQMLLESETIFPITVTTDLKNDIAAIESEVSVSFGTEISKTEVPEPVEKTTVPAEQKTMIEKDAEPVEETEIIRLKKENEALLVKVEKLEKLIEVYEEEINKKRSIKGFFGKFFS
ncbi:MAG TPA: hypothetical protein PLX56_01740 [bacterium]|nr:hypothetical protein [bacterium]HQN72530.1 hypothetical protein [bacterium]HQO91024.1 hypothetical protein [bacterium]